MRSTTIKGYAQNLVQSDDENSGVIPARQQPAKQCTRGKYCFPGDCSLACMVYNTRAQELNAAKTTIDDLRARLEAAEKERSEVWDYCGDLVQKCGFKDDKVRILNQQLAEANATIEQMRAALKEYFIWRNACGDTSKSTKELVNSLSEVDYLVSKALSTTPSQAVERQKRIVEAAKEALALLGIECRNCELKPCKPGDCDIKRVRTDLAAAVKEAE